MSSEKCAGKHLVVRTNYSGRGFPEIATKLVTVLI